MKGLLPNSIRALIFALIGATGLAHQTHATVIWSFYETSISCFTGSCFLPAQPYVLATLTLPGPTSAGTAKWQGGPVGPAPVYTGSDFLLTLPFTHLSPALTGPGCDPSGGP